MQNDPVYQGTFLQVPPYPEDWFLQGTSRTLGSRTRAASSRQQGFAGASGKERPMRPPPHEACSPKWSARAARLKASNNVGGMGFARRSTPQIVRLRTLPISATLMMHPVHGRGVPKGTRRAELGPESETCPWLDLDVLPSTAENLRSSTEVWRFLFCGTGA